MGSVGNDLATNRAPCPTSRGISMYKTLVNTWKSMKNTQETTQSQYIGVCLERISHFFFGSSIRPSKISPESRHVSKWHHFHFPRHDLPSEIRRGKMAAETSCIIFLWGRLDRKFLALAKQGIMSRLLSKSAHRTLGVFCIWIAHSRRHESELPCPGLFDGVKEP